MEEKFTVLQYHYIKKTDVVMGERRFAGRNLALNKWDIERRRLEVKILCTFTHIGI